MGLAYFPTFTININQDTGKCTIDHITMDPKEYTHWSIPPTSRLTPTFRPGGTPSLGDSTLRCAESREMHRDIPRWWAPFGGQVYLRVEVSGAENGAAWKRPLYIKNNRTNICIFERNFRLKNHQWGVLYALLYCCFFQKALLDCGKSCSTIVPLK